MPQAIKRVLKSLVVTTLAAIPLAIKLIPAAFQTPAIVAFLLVAFSYNFFAVFRPQDRCSRVVKLALDHLFSAWFDNGIKIRAHVFVRRGWFPIEWLTMSYSHGIGMADADYGIRFWRFCTIGQGLCWRVIPSGMVGFFDADVSRQGEFWLTNRQRLRTQHVQAILAFPIRRVEANQEFSWLDAKPIAVLCLDAVDSSGADFLRSLNDSLANPTESAKLRDLVDRLSLYF